MPGRSKCPGTNQKEGCLCGTWIIHQFEELTDEEKRILTDWIKANFIPRKTYLLEYTSYGLKHIFERDPNGFYVTNGQFKGAMLRCGFKPRSMFERNWVFAISKKSPAFKRKRNR